MRNSWLGLLAPPVSQRGQCSLAPAITWHFHNRSFCCMKLQCRQVAQPHTEAPTLSEAQGRWVITGIASHYEYKLPVAMFVIRGRDASFHQKRITHQSSQELNTDGKTTLILSCPIRHVCILTYTFTWFQHHSGESILRDPWTPQ